MENRSYLFKKSMTIYTEYKSKKMLKFIKLGKNQSINKHLYNKKYIKYHKFEKNENTYKKIQ